MSETFVYRTPTTPAGPGWFVELDNRIRLGDIDGIGQEAELGAVAETHIVIEDPGADAGHSSDAILGLKQFDWIEDEAPPGKRRIWTGYIGDRSYRRGDGDHGSLIQGPSRVIDATLADINSFLSFRVLGTDETSAFDRPAETDVERVLALLEVDFLSTTLFDGLVATASPVAMDENDYTDSTPADVLNDCAQQSGKNFFVFYDEAGDFTPSPGDFALFYGSNDDMAYLSDLKVSNVLGDVDFGTLPPTAAGLTATAGDSYVSLSWSDLRAAGSLEMTGPTWAPLKDAELTIDPSRVLSQVKVNYSGGSEVVTNLATSYEFGFRAAVYSAPTVKTAAMAIARANRYLTDLATEDRRLTVTLKLPAASVNDWRAGQAAQVKFSHLPGFADDFVWVRSLTRTVTQNELTPAFYDVRHECTPMTPPPGTPIGAFASWDSGSGGGIPILPAETTPGQVLLLFVACVGASASTSLGAARCFDDPDLGLPPVGPHADQGLWTQLDTAQTSALGQNILGAGAGFARSVTVLWRYVQPGETTTHPVAVSAPVSPGGAAAWLYQLPTPTPPTVGGTYATPVGSPPNVPADYSLPTVSGNAAGIIAWEFADTGDEAAYLVEVTGDTVTSSQSNNDPDNAVIGTGWAAPWVWIGQSATGGVLAVNMDTIPAYNNLAACGVSVGLPPDVVLVTIPYPANQV